MVLLFLIPFFFCQIYVSLILFAQICAILPFKPYTPPHFKCTLHSYENFTSFNIIIHTRHVAFITCYNTYIRTISIFSTITEYSSVFWHHGEINYSFGRYRIFTRPYIPILFQRPILFNLSPIRESNKNSKDSIIFPTFPAKFFFHLI